MHDNSAQIASTSSPFFSAASFWLPQLVNRSAWTTHAPFGFWLVGAQRPARIVELGVHSGYSYFAFCQAVRASQIPCECFAVDTWKGDEHAGFYDEDVFIRVKGHNDANYSDFSTLIRSEFDKALSRFEDGTVDLLHIDGRHYYDDVRRDFEAWRPKLSDSGVVLFHDTAETARGFGVRRLWEEVRQVHPGFEFLHGHGLGVLGVGANQLPALRALFAIDRDVSIRDLVRQGYARLGAAVEDRRHAASATSEIEKRRHAEAELSRTAALAAGLRAALDASLASRARVDSLAATVGELPPIASSLASVAGRLDESSKKVPRHGRAARAGARRARMSLLWSPERPRRGKRRKAPRAGSGVGPKAKQAATPIAATPSPAPSPPPPATPAVTPPATPTEGLITAAIQVIRNEGWRASAPLWQSVYETRASASRPNLFAVQASPVADFEEVTPRAAGAGGDLRWCIYTTLFGAYDDLRAPVDPPEGVDLICFTDGDATADGWRMIRVDPTDGPILGSRQYKILPHRHLAEYHASLYVDANTLLVGDIGRFVRRWCAGRPFVMWRHAQRCDVYDEAMAVLAQSKADPELVISQVTLYESAGLPRATGLVEAPFIWRDHADEDVRRLMDAWSEEVRTRSARDQISLGFLMWRLGIRPMVFPKRLGNARINCASTIVPHSSRALTRAHSLPRTAPPPAGRKRRVAFLYADEFRTSGVTTMRGFQLVEILRAHLGEEFEFDVTPDRNVRDAIVILTKGLLQTTSEYDMQRLARSNIGIVADPVDDLVRPAFIEFVDLIWAASIVAYRAALFARPRIDVDLVTHHVDPRIARQEPAAQFSVGYIGEPANAVLSPEIARLLTVVPVNTRNADEAWLSDVGQFALHYAVRQRRPGGHKPFLKGFTAARCGANILVGRADGDALYYLGDDYPFLLDNDSPATILAGIEVARQSFGGRAWKDGLDVMRHIETLCSPERIVADVRKSLGRFG